MAIQQVLSRTRAPVLWLTAATLMGAAVAAIAGNQPQIVVQFEVTSPSIKKSLPGATRATELETLEQALSNHLADKIRPLLGFAAWNAIEDTTRPVLGRLIARLNDEPAAEIPEIRVEWLSRRGDGPEVALGWALLPVVERNDGTVELGNRKAIEQLAKGKLDGIPGVILKANLLETFMARIPLATSVSANDTDHLVELPMQSEELPLGLKSVMKVEFRKPAPDIKEGQIELTRFGRSSSGALRAGVDEAIVNSRELVLTDNWHPELTTLFNGATVQCFLREYEPDGTLSEPLVVVPQ